jgi:hypothetical protein
MELMMPFAKFEIVRLKDEEKISQLRGIAEDLTFNMAAKGIPATTMQAVTGFAPKPPETIDQALLSPSGTDQARGEHAMTLKHNADLEKTLYIQAAADKRQQASFLQQMNMLGTKTGLKDQDKIGDSLKEFRDKVIKPEFDVLTKANSAKELAKSDYNSALGVLQRQIVGLSGDARVSDQDAAAVAPNPDVLSRVQRALKRASSGEPLQIDQNEFQYVIAAMERAAQRNIKVKAKNYSTARSRTLRGISPADLENALLVDHGLAQPAGESQDSAAPPSAPATNAPPSTALPSWIKPRGK